MLLQKPKLLFKGARRDPPGPQFRRAVVGDAVVGKDWNGARALIFPLSHIAVQPSAR